MFCLRGNTLINKIKLAAQAANLRKELGEDSSSPIDIFALVQTIDSLTLVFYPMGDKISGMCIKGESGNCVIGLNSSMSLGRQRFSLAHELYHMYYDDNMVTLCSKSIGEGIETEKKADVFASFFLIPEDELMRRSSAFADKHSNKKIGLNDIIRLEQCFGVSHQAMVIRLKDSGLIEKNKVDEYLNIHVRHRAELMGYSADLYMPLPENKQYRTYGLYLNQANSLLENGLISHGKYEQLLLEAFRSDLVFGSDEESDVID